MTTRLDLRNLVRRELADTSGSPLWADAQINDDLAAAFATYSEYFPNAASAASTSTAGQTTVALPVGVRSVDAVLIDNYAVPQVGSQAILQEPATRGIPSQSQVQPISATGAMASHVQAWAWFAQAVNFRFALTANRAIVVAYSLSHVLPGDDVTAVTVPDADDELIVLYACDRLVQSAATDAIKRGAPGAWVEGKGGITRYADRYQAALRSRRQFVRSGVLGVLQ